VILIQSDSQTQTNQGIAVNTNNFPIVDQITCFNIDSNRLIEDNIDSEFQILRNPLLPIYTGGNITLEECRATDLENTLKNLFQHRIQQDDIRKLLKYFPSKIYVIR
jgi:hypothetical protein